MDIAPKVNHSTSAHTDYPQFVEVFRPIIHHIQFFAMHMHMWLCVMGVPCMKRILNSFTCFNSVAVCKFAIVSSIRLALAARLSSRTLSDIRKDTATQPPGEYLSLLRYSNRMLNSAGFLLWGWKPSTVSVLFYCWVLSSTGFCPESLGFTS